MATIVLTTPLSRLWEPSARLDTMNAAHTGPEHIDRALVWLRRDLRLHDHAALHHALATARQVWCAFVFDTDILDALPRANRRVHVIRESLVELDDDLRQQGSGLLIGHGSASRVLPDLAQRLGVQAVFANRDYEPAAVARDAAVRGHLADAGQSLYLYKDQVVFDTDEVLTASGSPFSVFTPYKNAWLRRLRADIDLQPHDTRATPGQFGPVPAWAPPSVPTLADLDFASAPLPSFLRPGSTAAHERLSDFLDRLDDYADTRDFPARRGPSYLGMDLRFGTVSIRELCRLAHERVTASSRGAEVWLSELIWREFYMQVLHHHPRVVSHAFKPEYDALKWEHGRHADALYDAWAHGRTGYPLVDAGMRQLLETGYMHNRLRMVTASFLTKDLGIDWRRGEYHFAEHLNDHELASNNGGWQWSASTGCDAQPYFRIFNPVSQSRKFDPDGRFIRRYVPELAALPDATLHAPWEAKPLELAAAGIELGRDYPRPVVNHDEARQRTLARFAAVRGGTA